MTKISRNVCHLFIGEYSLNYWETYLPVSTISYNQWMKLKFFSPLGVMIYQEIQHIYYSREALLRQPISDIGREHYLLNTIWTASTMPEFRQSAFELIVQEV